MTAGPDRPLLVIDVTASNARSGGISVAREARHPGLKLLELRGADHYPEVDRAASEHRADALGACGGDASQWKAAVVACGRELPYACIPTGHDNVFARDLGVDPQDAIAALDALADCCEYYVDLGEVNGITFVNYAALGLDCRPARASGTADASAGATLAAYVVRRRHPPIHLDWFASCGPQRCTALFVSNNRCRFESHAIGGRTRLDGGVLGVGVLQAGGTSAAAAEADVAWRQLAVPVFEVGSDAPITADVDGQPVSLEPPVRFRVLPRALRARVALRA
jgi:diacylglycerol kinase family enzyme